MSAKPSQRTKPQSPHLVAKIGGSLWSSAALLGWLAALARFPHPVTIVPGGGPFADAVRKAQAAMRFSDATAHRMALLAMEQYALALADLDQRLSCVATPIEAAVIHAEGRIALWRPSAMASGSADIPASWDVTSDSLAAWYAGLAGARNLLLVKSVDATGAEIIAGEVVDPLFARYATPFDVKIAGPSDLAAAGAIFANGDIPGTTIAMINPRRQQRIAS
ncbi:MAG: aspartate kinase [Methylocystis sp.]|nr:aspartate kinase [Methylocystis sp.]MBI3275884.1 aspartate kinase [Methylocystis sp.]